MPTYPRVLDKARTTDPTGTYARPILPQGAVADGTSHPLSERYSTLAAAQAVYPHVTALTQEIDWAALQGAINAVPDGSTLAGGWIALPAGHYFCGADGLVGSRPSVWLLGLGAPSYGASSPTKTRTGSVVISGNGAGMVLLTTGGNAGGQEHRGWRVENIEFRDSSAGGDQIAGAVRLDKHNFNRYINCDFQDIWAGYAVQLDGTGSTCQYNEFWGCRARKVLHGIQVVNNADDTLIFGGSWFGTAAAGGVGIQMISSSRIIGTNIQGFESCVTMDGNNCSASDLRGDLSAGAVTRYIRVLGTARDAKIVNPIFGGTAPSGNYIEIDSGALRTKVVAPSTNTSALGITDAGTDTKLITGLTGVLTSATSQVTVSNTTTETTLGSVSVAAGSVSAGTTFGWRLAGQVDNIATSGTLTIRAKMGGATVAQIQFASGASGTTLRNTVLSGRLTFRTSGAAATWAGEMTGTGGPGTSVQQLANSSVSGSTIATNNTQTLSLTASWATADPGNVLRVESLQIELLKA